MSKRVTVKKKKKKSQYFDMESDVVFYTSGCALLDGVLGGGWASGRVTNIVGDKSVGKTLLAIEATANFHRAFPKGKIIFNEPEHAFDEPFAERLGLPPGKVDFSHTSDTVEAFFNHMESIVRGKRTKEPLLYILDSLDSLSDEAELGRDIDKGTFGSKAKKLSEIFRRLTGKMKTKNVQLFVVSQIRDNVGVMFGEKQKRMGGKALDFYAAQVLWLKAGKQIVETKTINGKKIKRPTGVTVEAYCKKNKVGLPFRRCNFPLIFNYGIDDEAAARTWAEEVGLVIPKKLDRDSLNKLVMQTWNEIEQKFMPTKRKYV